jgi:hypothetical protein
MIFINNKIFPFGRFKAINLFGIIFHKGKQLTDIEKNHVAILNAQMRELLYLPFYLIYVLEWLIIRLYDYRMTDKAYCYISFEKEAYDNENNPRYLAKRKHFAQWKWYSRFPIIFTAFITILAFIAIIIYKYV